MRRISLSAWLFLLVLALNLYAAVTPANSLMMYWFSSDDAFYYFKTAQNIAEGRGITFDGLARASGFHPLWMAVCVPVFALARFDLILPLRLIVVISGLLSAGTAVLLFRIARRAFSTPAAFLTALFFAYSPFVHSRIVQLGLESGLSIFFIVLLFERVASATTAPDGGTRARLYAQIGGVAALTLLARLDNVFFILTAGAWLVVSLQPRFQLLAMRTRTTLAIDLALIIFGVLWSYFVRVGFGPHYGVLAESSYWMAALAVVVRVPLYYLLGLYAPPLPGRRGLVLAAGRAVLAGGLATLLLGGVMLALQTLGAFPGFPRLVLLYEGGFALAALLLTRSLPVMVAAFQRQPAAPEPGPVRPADLRATLLRGAAYAAPVALTLAVYMAASQAYFGTSSPVSGQIKRWWGTLPNPIYGKPVDSLTGMLGLTGRNEAWEMVGYLFSQPEAAPDLLRWGVYALLVGGLVWFQRRRVWDALRGLPLLPIFTGGFIQLISYTGTGYVHTRGWYWSGQMLLICLLLGVLLDALLQALEGWRNQRTMRILAVGLAAWIVISGALELANNVPLIIQPENEEAYLGGMRNLEASTEPGSLVGSTGGGVIAYFVSQRTIVNLDGLMNSTEYFHLLQAGRASEYLNQIGLDYVYTGATVITDSDPYFQFKHNLVRLQEFPGITLFRWVRGEQ